jgi:hypothetical protein
LNLVRKCTLMVLLAALIGVSLPLGLTGAGGGGRACAAQATAAPKRSAPGPFVLSSPDSLSQLRLRLFVQLLLEYTSADKVDQDRSNTLVMYSRRIRPTVELNLAKPRLFFKLHLSTAPKSLELMDCYFDLGLKRDLFLRYGQYKVPFTLYRIESFQALTLVDWAIVTKGFGAERQMGFSIHNGFEKPPRLGYVFGVFTGVNARASHAVWLPRAYGIKNPPNPSDLANPAPYAEWHPELFLRLSFNHGKIDVRSNTDDTGGPLRYSAAMSAGWDLDPTPHEDFRLLLAPELLAKCRGWSARAVWYAGFVEPASRDKTELGMTGLLFEPAYRFNERYEIAGRYAAVYFTEVLLDDVSRYLGSSAASTKGGLLSSGEAPGAPALSAGGAGFAEAAAAAPSSGLIEREEEARIGLNVYLAGHSLKWQNDFGALMHHDEIRTLTDFVVRSQFQLIY